MLGQTDDPTQNAPYLESWTYNAGLLNDQLATERAITASQEGAGGTGGGAGQGQAESLVLYSGPGMWDTVTEWVAKAGSTVAAPVQGILTGIEWTGKLLPVILIVLGGVAIYVMAPRAPGGK